MAVPTNAPLHELNLSGSSSIHAARARPYISMPFLRNSVTARPCPCQPCVFILSSKSTTLDDRVARRTVTDSRSVTSRGSSFSGFTSYLLCLR
ncbi:hypothetical protein HETIRDRAFT_163993 [Heterobasidion irregulare TC 32-1]|uniref:Uncharacterized protein n=1 Tax=Heterobasidion irregulare (strain TC 32-1) TaxID=747525 RepID=W4JX28_HETIT|nr:uncharacterized protein HETIRDRAFT_163993 [Heterobasidion irregulare TC 32-1]ETW78014.1 hypothetical protein HETIRDRAFT_163993 [Heterobasidion irregulare TC 32-1]